MKRKITVNNYPHQLTQEDDAEKEYLNDQVEELKSNAKNNNISYDDLLAYYGFKDDDAVKDYFRLTYRRDKAVNEYISKELKDSEIEDYYKDKVYGDIKVKHILIAPDTSDDMTTEEKENAEKEAKKEADCKTTLYPLNEAVDVPKWTYHHMELAKKPEIEEILGHKYKGTYHEPVNSVEFVPLGVNKAKGIEVILEHTGISREDSYAFGDSANDIDMIKYVKYGVAMGNSVPELLETAPYQTARVDEDGIEKGLKKFGLI